MLFSEGNPFELAQVIAASKTKAPAKKGDVAPEDIVIPEGPTNLPPGPAIGELQRAKIQAGVEGDKIVVKKSSTVAKKGDSIDAGLADLLTKLEIEPMEISLNLLAVWDQGMVFDKELLFIPKEHYIHQLETGYAYAFNLSINIGHITRETVPVLIAKAHQEAFALAMEIGEVSEETVGPLLAKASAQASALNEKADMPAPSESQPENEPAVEEEPKQEEEKTKEKPAEEEKPAEMEDAGKDDIPKEEESKPEEKPEEKKEQY